MIAKSVNVVGHLDSWLYPAKVLFDGEMRGGDTPPRRTKRQRLAAGSESGTDPAKWWDGSEQAGTLTVTSNNQFMPDKARLQCVIDMRQVEAQDESVAPTLIATDYKGGKAVCEEVCPTPDANYPQKMNRHDVTKLVCYENNPTDARLKEVPVSPTVLSRWGTGGNQTPVVLENQNPSAAPDENRRDEAQRKDSEPSKNGAAEVIPKQMELVAFIKNDAGGDQDGYWEDVFPTVRSQVTPAVAYNVTFCDANGTRKDRPDGGLYVTPADASKTVTTGGTNAETVVVALDGDKMGKAERKGGSGLGVSEDEVMYTQTVNDVHAVAYREKMSVVDMMGGKGRCGVSQTDVSPVISADTQSHAVARNECVPLDLRNATRDPEKHDEVNRQGVGIGEDGDPMNTVTASSVPGIGWQATVRRLLPVECERLMGFPDNHTRIPWKGLPEEECPDAPRYKACGNSMCVNVMSWVGQRIEQVEKIIQTEASHEASESTPEEINE